MAVATQHGDCDLAVLWMQRKITVIGLLKSAFLFFFNPCPSSGPGIWGTYHIRLTCLDFLSSFRSSKRSLGNDLKPVEGCCFFQQQQDIRDASALQMWIRFLLLCHLQEILGTLVGVCVEKSLLLLFLSVPVYETGERCYIPLKLCLIL